MPDRGISFRDLCRLIDAGVPSRGVTFYVDTTNGANTYSGLEPDRALDTITAAIALCSAGRRDTVYVLEWFTDNGETWPLPMSVAGVTLRGMPTGGMVNSSMGYITSVGNYGCVTISANYCRLQTLMLSCASNSYDAVSFSGVPGGTGILGCHFAVCKDAVGGGVGASTTLGWTSVIADNFFTSQVADHGVYVYNPAQILIEHNTFSRVQGSYAMELIRPGLARVFDNRFALETDTLAAAIFVHSGTVDAIFDGNRANYHSNDEPSNNPFLDQGSEDRNAWLLNYGGIEAIYPANAF